MAFGIDDALAAAAAGISLTDTVVRTVESYRNKNEDLDIELLIEEVRVTVLRGIDEADHALSQLDRMLSEKGVDTNRALNEVIASTPWWRPVEQFRLKRIRRTFNELADATYDASDDIAALVRCRDQTGKMGIAVVDSARAKHELHAGLRDAISVNAAIALLRSRLLTYKSSLMQ